MRKYKSHDNKYHIIQIYIKSVLAINSVQLSHSEDIKNRWQKIHRRTVQKRSS